MKILALYLILLGFNSAFSLTEILPIPLVISFFLLSNLFLFAIKKQEIKFIETKTLTIIFCFFISLLVSLLYQVNSVGFESRGINHTLSYITVILMYFVLLELTLKNQNVSIETIYKYITIGVLVVSLFTIIEFFSKNFFGINIDNYIYRPRVQELNATYANQFIRARGPAEEPSYLSLYLLMFLPFVIYYYYQIIENTKKMIIYSALVLTAVILTFSAIAYVEILIALFLVGIYYFFKKIKRGFKNSEYIIIYSLIFFITTISSYIIYNGIKLSFFEGIFNKISLNNSTSALERLERWESSLSMIKQNLLIGGGAGITAIKTGTGSTNVYLEVLAAVGIIGFSSFIAMFLISLISLFKIESAAKFVYLFSFIIMFIHLATTSQYHNPWIWTLLAIVNYHASMYNEGALEYNKTLSIK